MRLGVVTGLLSFSALVVGSHFFRSSGSSPRPVAVRPHDVEVAVWVGELAPGVKVVLASPWNQRDWDEASDATLRDPTGAAIPSDLVLYDCWLFNTGAAASVVELAPGALVLRPKDAPSLPLRSLASWLTPDDRGRRVPEGGAAAVARALGGGRDVVELPPGRMHRHLVAFARRIDLAELEGVTRADGAPFRLRRMRESEWAALIQSPRRTDVENL